MNVVILGAGIGAVLLSVLWTLAFILCFISLRTKYNIGPIAVSITILITLILLSVPRKSDIIQSLTGEKVSVKIYSHALNAFKLGTFSHSSIMYFSVRILKNLVYTI